MVPGTDVEMEGYKTPAEAYYGHMRFCEKYAKKK